MSDATVTATHAPDLHDVQGDLIGFNKDHQRLVFVRFADQGTARSFLQALEPNIASGYEVLRFNDLYKEIRVRRRGERGIIQATWTNIALTFKGLEMLAPSSGLESFPTDFRDGMAAHAGELGDTDLSAPSTWRPPFDAPQQIHAMVILAADDPAGLEASYARLQDKLTTHNVTELGREDGSVRPDAMRGHEHFGFKDGISQPGIRGLTKSSKNPDKTIEPGEFLIGYPDEAGHTSGEPEPPTPEPQPGQPGYGQPVPPPMPPMAPWTKGGSFLVYRRLRQDVGAFNAFVQGEASQLSMPPEQVGAKLVGRWASGAPMERVPGLPKDVDPSAADPSPAHPAVLDDGHINQFDYADDADGTRVPRAAHIRKSYPRAQVNPGLTEADRHRILRRGIPYGPEFQPTEQPYDQGPVSDERDRGLLFLCYQASIARGFAFIQQTWVNDLNFPEAGDGQDPIISQQLAQRDFNMPPQQQHLSMARWVFRLPASTSSRRRYRA